MDLKEFDFPVLSKVDLAFSTLKADKTLLAEAEARGFDKHSNEYNQMFSTLFFKGGRVEFKQDVDAEWSQKVWTYCRALMRSFEPKHEHKEAICAMLMSEILEPKLKEAAAA